MNRSKLLVTCSIVSYSVLMLPGEPRYELTIDTTNRPGRLSEVADPSRDPLFRATPRVFLFGST